MNTQGGNWWFAPLAGPMETERDEDDERRRSLWVLALSAITAVAAAVIGLALAAMVFHR
jgi:hypothetical protein